MIELDKVTMRFPISRRYVDYVLRPFSPPKYFTALNQVNLSIQAGDRVAILGPNGAGKTTMLKLIGGLIYPSEGSLLVEGHNTVLANREARKSVGYVLNEERSFYWRLTGFQNLMFFGALDNLREEDLEQRVHHWTQLVGLEKAIHKEVSKYSSGMKQRLALARGLIPNPSILILDEPTRTLDPIAAIEVKNILLTKIHQSQIRTLLIATHRLDEASDLCNKICMIKSGEIQFFGSREDVVERFGDLEKGYQAVFGTPNKETE